MSSRPTWSDFYDEGLGPPLPLAPEQRVSPVSGVLPSGEGGGFDPSQNPPINTPFPYPNTSTRESLSFSDGQRKADFPDNFSDEWWDTSGIMSTAPPFSGVLVDENQESGIFHFNGLSSAFSNGQIAKSLQIENFTIFNPYVHHEHLMSTNRKKKIVVEIPFISTYTIAIDFRPYG